MYKMREVCQRTGLTEKTIRFYIQENMISPQVELGLHYHAYRFSDSDIERLKNIAALRKADFSISEIKTMLTNPDEAPRILAEKEALLSRKLKEMHKVKTALEGLTAQDRTDYEKIADAIDPRTPERQETPHYSRNRWLWLGIYAGIFLVLGLTVTGLQKIWLLGVAVLFLAGIAFPIKAMRFFWYNHYWKKLENKAVGTVISVVPDEGIEGIWEETAQDRLHDAVSVGFLHWSWINPDHWVPMIQFEADGVAVTSAYRYGWLKCGWQTDEKVEVAYKGGKEKQIYPCGDPVIRKKAWAYLLAGLTALILFAVVTVRIMMQ